ncbi:MAG: winged helix DNA-binding protein, partial [Bacteroidales bacterium]|nr:winged helix DNA-binding protein [Candidatus Equibacterium intestinale]
NEIPISQQVKADTINKQKNSITNLAEKLQRKGYVVRKKDDYDRRSKILTLTEKAESLKLEAKEKGISILEQIIEGISEEDLTVFLNTLEKLSDNMTVTQDQPSASQINDTD